jgi:ASPIC and UnbV/FG-GAP-like repeat
MNRSPSRSSNRLVVVLLVGLMAASACAFIALAYSSRAGQERRSAKAVNLDRKFEPRTKLDTSGFTTVVENLPPWKPDSTLEELSRIWSGIARRDIAEIDGALSNPRVPASDRFMLLMTKVMLFNYDGEPRRAYELLEQTRPWVQSEDALAEKGLYTLIYLQGVAALRRGETDNCVMCRGESSCILPIAPAAVHADEIGSRLAIRHFTEYLEKFPGDQDVRWLLNVAHMTLGEYPDHVDSRYRVSIDPFIKSEFDIGKFRDIGHLAGVNRFNMAGGAVMEDFDNDGLLDLATTSVDPTMPMAYYRNEGDGSFKEKTEPAGLLGQLGGKNLVQTDFNNDGQMDLFISRGAWLDYPMRQSLLRNNRDGTFSDVTEQTGLFDPVNSTHSCWADYDNDGWLDVYIICEQQTNRLYHNKGDGTFEELSARAGVAGVASNLCKGCDWIDYDNDNYPDLFVNNMRGTATLYHNNRNGTFTDVTESMGIDGPQVGFSCWAWDYDNDGWLDIFATSFDYSVGAIVNGMIGQPHKLASNRLWRNSGGRKFENRTIEAGLDLVFATMGCNFGDFDNDGWLDFYLGTGAPDLGVLVPNRMFKNVEGHRFADITASSGTGNLQKGHGVSCADWDRDGDVDLFIEMGGATPGDRYHNILFENPGQGNHWLSLKLTGVKTNRPAIGARIKVVTAGDHPLTIYRQVSSGSSWGANPLEQHIGLAKSERIAVLEIHWPTSGSTQVFRDLAADQAIQVTEFADQYQVASRKPIPSRSVRQQAP